MISAASGWRFLKQVQPATLKKNVMLHADSVCIQSLCVKSMSAIESMHAIAMLRLSSDIYIYLRYIL